MSNSDSEDFESADEDLNVSDIGEDELEELLADVPDPEELENKLNIEDRLKGKDASKNSSELKAGDNTDYDNSKSNKVEDDSFVKSSENPAKSVTDKSGDSLNNLVKIECNDVNAPVKPIISTSTSIANEIFSNKTDSEKITQHSSLGCDNASIDDNSNGWDFDDDVLSPENESIEHVQNSSTAKMVDYKHEHVESNTVNSGWSGWGSWGVSNLINSASEGVSNLSLTMTSGFTSMLETTIGAPDPQELARQLAREKDTKQAPDEEAPRAGIGSSDLFGLGNIIGGVSTLGSKVISGGLDTLETLGKKTMEVLQEGDPGFKKKRALLFQGDKVILSQVLREAKEKAEASEQEKEQDKSYRKVQYESLFDDFHGLVHLEALEMISKQCEIKLNSLLSKSNTEDLIEFNEICKKVKDLFDQQHFSDDSDKSDVTNINLKDKLNSTLALLELNLNTKNMIEIDAEVDVRLSQAITDATEIHVNAISDLAQYTAVAIELFHRIAELLVDKKNSIFENDFQALVSITVVTKSKIGTISDSYTSKIMTLSDKTFSPLITNIFLEASNSGVYLENAFELFLPILQLKALS